MGTFVDLLLILIIVYFIIMGKRRGFVRTLLSFAARIASVAAALFVSNEYAQVLYDSYFKDSVIENIKARLDTTSETDLSEQISAAIEGIPNALSGIAEMLGVNTDVLGEEIKALNLTGDIALVLEESVAGPLMVVICKIIIFAVVSAVASFVLNIIVNIICNIVKLPVLRSANGLLGAVLGLVNGIIVVLIVSYICVIASSLIGNNEFSEIINSSHLITYLTSISLFI